MSIVGGDIVEITFNHPTLGSGSFEVKSAEDSTYDLGGFRTDDDSNGVTGSGSNIKKMNNNRWFFEAPVAWNNTGNSDDTLEVLTALSGDPVDAEYTITHMNKSIHGATGSVVGDVQGNGNAATVTFKVSGGGEMKKLL